MPNKYQPDFKRRVIKRYEKGESIKNLSKELNIAQSTIYQWRKQYCSILTPKCAYTPQEFNNLSLRVQKLGHEIEIIRLSGYLEAVPLRKKLETLENIYRKEDLSYSVHELCEALGVARGTFYNHIFRRVDRSDRDRENEELMLKVRQIFDDSQQRYGADKIKAVLGQSGVQVSVKRVSAIMRELDLRSVRTDAKKQYKKIQRTMKKNLVERDFSTTHPNQIWVSDITYFKVNNYWVYLCIILDLFSRKVVGYIVSRNQSTNLVTTTFRNAYQTRGKPKNLTFHSDRGKQYTSAAFTKLLQTNGVKQSFSATARPIDNAVAESFFASFKKEEAYRREYTSEQNFYKSVEQYIQFYNEVRPYQTLKYQTPQAVEDKFYCRFIENECSNSVRA